MQTGFDTIGNATLIAYDQDKPILVTDPWIQGEAYFGSWGLSHEIPPAQLEAAKNAEYVWFSHGHPDHLNGNSLELFKGKKILLPDHVGGRIKKDLESQGYNVSVLRDREWTKLSEHVRVLCISDFNQDGILLVDINGRLALNLNDAVDHGWGGFVKKEVKKFKTSVLLALFGFGDADMINFYDESGKFVEPWAAKRHAVGWSVTDAVNKWGVTHIIPFSSLHRYQRADSIWANQYATKSADYYVGYNAKNTKLLPAFLRFNCETDEWTEIHPKESSDLVRKPEDFGDNWSDALDAKDVALARTYFHEVEHLHDFLDYINLRVGGKDHTLSLGTRNFKRGISFEVPRGSLMTSLEYKIFDDLLIGNFMKTTLHGKWPSTGLYPDFSPYLAKYADNGLARSKEELRAYFEEYKRRAPLEFFLHGLEVKSHDLVRFTANSLRSTAVYPAAKTIYNKLKGR